MKRNVLLVSMPFGPLERQALGLSLLKPQLQRRGFLCDVRYLNLRFAELTGYEEYVWLNYEAPYTAFAGDWTFTEALYGKRAEADRRYIAEVLKGTWRMPAVDVNRIERIRALAIPFLDHCLAAVPWDHYGLVGFTSTFEQNIASLAMAKRVKTKYPKLKIVFGGANWEGEMGQELHRQFEFVDFVCCGESEISFPALVEAAARGSKPAELEMISGIIYRYKGNSVATGTAERVASMDDLPVPDYADYYTALQESSVSNVVVPHLLFESSRGCWWGAKSHCTFCGLNGGSMAFRSKSTARALAELRTLTSQWQAQSVEAVDNILDNAYFRDFLPALAQANMGIQIFYEVKANLTRTQLRQLRDAGVTRIQPGIESLNNHVLKLMRKGTTGVQNIQLLKWSGEYGVTCDWNLLYGFPGERREDYLQLMDLLPLLRHLHPPTACGPLRLDRFSPYHEDPNAFGIRNVRPLSTYDYLYPFTEESLLRLAYYFDYDYESSMDPRGIADDVVRYCAEWKLQPEHGVLVMIRKPDGRLGILDTRPSATHRGYDFGGLEQLAYEFCDAARTTAAVTRHLSQLVPGSQVGDDEVRGFLQSAVANRIMVCDGAHYLSLAQAAGSLRQELEERREGRETGSPQPLARHC